MAKLQEVAAAIDYFRKSGKPVIAFGEFYDQPQYYLAAHADEIYLDPQGIAYVDGFANYGMFIKDALDKLSIDWNVFRVGQYKSAVEMFTRNDMSPAEREESLVWLSSIWRTWKADVAKARGMKPDAFQAYADDAANALRRADGDLARMALDAGLVTALEGRYKVEERLAEITGEDEDEHSYQGIDHGAYLAQHALERGAQQPARRQGSGHRRLRRDCSGRAVTRHDRLGHAGASSCVMRASTMTSRPSCCASTARVAVRSRAKSSAAKLTNSRPPRNLSSRR